MQSNNGRVKQYKTKQDKAQKKEQRKGKQWERVDKRIPFSV